MARKRVNKKLITILSLAGLTFLVIVVVVVLSWKFKDAQPFYDEALVLFEQAKQVDAEIEAEAAKLGDPEDVYKRTQELQEEKAEEVWKEVIDNLQNAFRYSRGNYALKNQALEQMVEVYLYQKDYSKAVGVWNEMFKLDAKNYDAKWNIVDFYYDYAKNGGQNWRDLRDQTDVLIELRPEDTYGYLVKANALIGMLMAGMSDDPVRDTKEVDEMLVKAAELEPANRLGYKLLALKELLKLKDVSEPAEQRTIRDQAGLYIKEGLSKNPEMPDAYNDLFEIYYLPLLRELFPHAVRAQEEGEQSVVQDFEQVAGECEKELEESISHFPEDGRFYVIQSQVNRLRKMVANQEWLDQSISLVEKALTCPNIDGGWFIIVADYYRLRSENNRDGKMDLEKAFTLLREGLYHSTLIDLQGSDSIKARRLRYGSGLPLLVDISADLASRETDESKQQWYLSKAQGAVKELQDSIGEDQATSKIAAGVLALAEGQTQTGIKYFYEAEQKQKASGIRNPNLDKRMFYALRDTEYQDLALQYAVRAMISGGRTEKLLIDCMATMQNLRSAQYVAELGRFLELYERYYGTSENFQEEYLALKANYYLRQGQYKEAQEVLRDYQGDKEEFKILRARSLATEEERLAASKALALENPSQTNLVNMLYNFYVSKGAEDPSNYEEARQVLDAALAQDAENLSLRHIRLLLDEPDPASVTDERKREIYLGLLQAISDPVEKSKQLGQFYLNLGYELQVRGEEETALTKFNLAQEQYELAAKKVEDDLPIQVSLFRVAIAKKDWSNAQRLVGTISKKDSIIGLSVEADLKIAQEKWEEVATVLEKYLQERPVSSQGHANLAQAYIQLATKKQNEKLYKEADNYLEKALAQIQESYLQDNQNIRTMNIFASLLHRQNERKGLNNLSITDITNMLGLIEKALELNSSNEMMIRLGAAYYPLWTEWQRQPVARQRLSEEERTQLDDRISKVQEKSISLCRLLASQNPQQVENWQILAQLVYQYSQQMTAKTSREKMIADVDQIYQEGMAANPSSPQLAAAYGEFLREIGRESESEQALLDIISGAEGEEKITALLNLGAMYYRHQDFEKTEKVLTDILQADEKNVAALRMLSGVAIQKNDYETALNLYMKLRQIEDREDLMAGQIEAMLVLGQVEEAEQLLGELQQKYPDYIGTQLLSARVELRKANYAATIAYANQVLETNDKNYQAYLLKAQALFYDQKLTQALDSLKALRAVVPTESSIGRMDLAKVYLAMNRYDEAITELEAALQYEPKNDSIRKMLLRIFRNLKRWVQLERLYDDTLKVYPNSVNAHLEAGDSALQLVRMYLQEGNQEKAKEQMRRGLSLMDKAWKIGQEVNEGQFAALRGLIRAMQLANQNQEIIQVVDQHLLGEPTDSLLLLSKAEALSRISKGAEALETYGKAMELAEGQSALETVLVDGAVRIGDYESVQNWLKQKITEQPDRIILRMSLASLHRANGQYEQEMEILLETQKLADADMALQIDHYLSIIYERTGQKDKAIACYRRILKTYPDNVTVINNLAYSLLEKSGQEEEALKLAEMAYQKARNNADIIDTYVVALLKKQDYVKAESLIRRAIQEKQYQNEPVSAAFVYHLAMALDGQGRVEKAREQYENALSMISENQQVLGESDLPEKIEQALKNLGN